MVEDPAFKGHPPSDHLREGGKTLSVLVHTFLLSVGANVGLTISVTPLMHSQSTPLVRTKISDLGPVLSTCLE